MHCFFNFWTHVIFQNVVASIYISLSQNSTTTAYSIAQLRYIQSIHKALCYLSSIESINCSFRVSFLIFDKFYNFNPSSIYWYFLVQLTIISSESILFCSMEEFTILSVWWNLFFRFVQTITHFSCIMFYILAFLLIYSIKYMYKVL